MCCFRICYWSLERRRNNKWDSTFDMRIIIETNPEIDNAEEKVFRHFKEVCKEGFKKFKLEIEGTTLIFEQ